MSFKKMNKTELLKIADDFGVEIKEDATNESIVAELLEMGVTYEDYKKFQTGKTVSGTESQDSGGGAKAPAKQEEAKVLLKMERENGTYEIYGYRFTHTHPFVAVKESDADYICRKVEGFRPALPSEVQEYYG